MIIPYIMENKNVPKHQSVYGSSNVFVLGVLLLSIYGCHTSIDPPAFSPTWCSHAGDRSQRPGSDFDSDDAVVLAACDGDDGEEMWKWQPYGSYWDGTWTPNLPTQLNLVGGFNPSEKYESQLGLFFPIYGKIIQMFQTTNQQFNLLCWKPIWPMTITFSGKSWDFPDVSSPSWATRNDWKPSAFTASKGVFVGLKHPSSNKRDFRYGGFHQWCPEMVGS